MCITLKTEGRRVYFQGNTFAAKDAIKDMGGKWDADQRMWWVGTTKKEAAETLVSKLANAAPAPQAGSAHGSNGDRRLSAEQLEETVVRARATYKGKSYYVAAEGETRVKLIANDGFTFWADRTAVEYTRRYGRENFRSGRIEYPTIGSLKRFAERARAEERADEAGDSPMKRCWECGNMFTQRDARVNDGDWADSYCGC